MISYGFQDNTGSLRQDEDSLTFTLIFKKDLTERKRYIKIGKERQKEGQTVEKIYESRILLVDDNRELCDMVQRLMKKPVLSIYAPCIPSMRPAVNWRKGRCSCGSWM